MSRRYVQVDWPLSLVLIKYFNTISEIKTIEGAAGGCRFYLFWKSEAACGHKPKKPEILNFKQFFPTLQTFFYIKKIHVQDCMNWIQILYTEILFQTFVFFIYYSVYFNNGLFVKWFAFKFKYQMEIISHTHNQGKNYQLTRSRSLSLSSWILSVQMDLLGNSLKEVRFCSADLSTISEVMRQLL